MKKKTQRDKALQEKRENLKKLISESNFDESDYKFLSRKAREMLASRFKK